MQSPRGEEEGRGDDHDDRQTIRQRQDERAESDIAAGRSEERSLKDSVANDSKAEGQEGGCGTLARATGAGENQDGHTPFEGGGGAEAEMALAQKAAILPGWLWGAWGNTANPSLSGVGGGEGIGGTTWDPQQWLPSYMENGTSPVSPTLAATGSTNANAKGKADWGKEAIGTQVGGLRRGTDTGYRGGSGRGGNMAGSARGDRRGRDARIGGLTRDSSRRASTGGRRTAIAPQRRSPTSLAVYDWGLELHKGGVREVFTATVDKVEMVKVWANGDVTINTGTIGRTPATKTILNLVLAIFKVEIAEDEAGAMDANEVVWRVVHSSGYKQPYAEKMSMSLFPNRDWPYTKTKLKRLPTKIFLPKPQRSPNQTRGMTRPTEGETCCGEAGVGTKRGEADENGGRDERQHDVLSTRGFDGKVFRGCYPRSDINYKSSNTDGDHHHLVAAAASVARVASFVPPQAPVGSPMGDPLGNPAAALAAAAIKEGVPAHLIHHLMMSGGAAAALSGQMPSNYTAAMAAMAAAAAAAATRADGNVDGCATVGAAGHGGAAEQTARLDNGRERRESPGNVDDSVVLGRDRGTRRPGGDRNGMEAADSFSSLRDPQLVPGGVATTTRASEGSLNDLGIDTSGTSSSNRRYGSGDTSFSQRIPSRTDSRGAGNSGLNHGAASAAAGGWRWPTHSSEAWQPWQPDDGSTSPSPPRGAAKKRHLTPPTADIEDGGGWRRRTDGQWERRRDVAEEDQTRRDHHRGLDAGFGSNGSGSRERASEDRRRGRRRRSDSRDSREHLVVDARRRRDSRSRERSESRRRSGFRRRSGSRDKGLPWSLPQVELSPFSRALVGDSSNRCAASSATAGGESFGRNATDVRDSAGGDTRAGRRSNGPWNDRDDASVGRPENGNRMGDGDGGDASAGDDVNLRARSSGGGDDGGMGQRRESYDPDRYDPDAYDPGEVTVKRENSGLQRQDSKRSASSESLTMAGNPKRSRSSSGSLSRGGRYQGGGLSARERFVGAGGGNDCNDANTPHDRGVGFGLTGAGGGTPQHPLLDPSDNGSTRNSPYGNEHIGVGSGMYIGDDGQQSGTYFTASAEAPAHAHVSNVLQSSLGSMGRMQEGPGFHAPGVVLGSQTLAPGDGVGVYTGWEAQGGSLGAAGGEGEALIRGQEQQMWSRQHQSRNQLPQHEQDNFSSHDQQQQQQHVKHPTVYLPHGQQDGGGYAADPVLTPPPPPPRGGVWISGGGAGGRHA